MSEKEKVMAKTTSDQSGANIARDGNIAILEEFEAAQKKNTKEAYELFIKRHPSHELAQKAKKQMQALEKRK